MADKEIIYTPNLNLAKQPTGAENWGEVLNDNFDKIDEAIKNAGGADKIGAIKFGFWDKAPDGCMEANGTWIYKMNAPALYEAVERGDVSKTTPEEYENELESNKVCAKFALDTTLERVRLPFIKDVYIKAADDLNAGQFGEQSLPNITGSMVSGTWTGGGATGAFSEAGYNHGQDSSGNDSRKVYNFDASLSSTVYQNGADVNPKHINLKAYVVVYTSKTTEIDMSEEFKLNNPFFFGMSLYSSVVPNNASWLLSDGAWHNGLLFDGFYKWLSEQISYGTAGFKTTLAYAFSGNGLNVWFPVRNPVVGATAYSTVDGSAVGTVSEIVDNNSVIVNGVTVSFNGSGNAGESLISDYDYVANPNDSTFRLPLKVLNASGNRIKGNEKTLGLSGNLREGGLATASTSGTENYLRAGQTTNVSIGNNANVNNTGIGTNNTYLGITTNPDNSGMVTADNDLSLYFYVGAVIQDAPIINVSGLLTELTKYVNKTSAKDRALVTSWGMPDYSAKLENVGNNYTAPTEGIYYFSVINNNGTRSIFINGEQYANIYNSYGNQGGIPIFLNKGDNVIVSSADTWLMFSYFIPLKGAN